MISQSDIRSYSKTEGLSDSAGSIRIAKTARHSTAFLCHSHIDRDLAERLQSYLQSRGWVIYIDWQDAGMSSTPNEETAAKIKNKIVELDWFLFLATTNSMNSKWCPWELGYADGKKGLDPVVIIPTVDDNGRSYGNEYIQLYKRITEADAGGLGIFGPNNRGNLLKNL